MLQLIREICFIDGMLQLTCFEFIHGRGKPSPIQVTHFHQKQTLYSSKWFEAARLDVHLQGSISLYPYSQHTTASDTSIRQALLASFILYVINNDLVKHFNNGVLLHGRKSSVVYLMSNTRSTES